MSAIKFRNGFVFLWCLKKVAITSIKKLPIGFCLSLVFEESCNYVDKEATHWFLQYQRNGRLFLNTIFFIHLLWYDNEISMSAKSTPPIDLLYYLIMSGQLAFTFFSLLH